MVNTVLFNPNFHAIMNYRFANFLNKSIVFLPIVKLLMYFNRVVFSIDIDYRAEIGGGFKIIHGIGLVIGKDVTARRNLTVYQGVTIGGNGKKRNSGGMIVTQPQFGTNVTVYTQAVVIGPCIIEDNVEIGANSVITKDIKKDIKVFNKIETKIKL